MTEELLEKITTIATTAHAGEFRRDNKTPYVEHLFAVENRVKQFGLEYRAVALLHDIMENTKITANDLLVSGVPVNVVTAVQLLTKTPDRSYKDYLLLIKPNELARKVKIADMLSNLADDPTDYQIRKYSRGLLTLVDYNEN